MKNKIKVVVKRPQEKAFVAEIDKGLASLQNFVDGLIECVEMPRVKNVDIILNEEGKLLGLPFNFFLPEYRDVVAGTAVIAGFNPRSGNHISLTDEQIEQAQRYLEHTSVRSNSEVFLAVQLGFDKIGRFNDLDLEM